MPSSVWTWKDGDGEEHRYYQDESAALPVAESGGGTDLQCMYMRSPLLFFSTRFVPVHSF